MAGEHEHVPDVPSLLVGWTPANMDAVDSVVDVWPNPYRSRTRSVVVDVTTMHGSAKRLLLKYGRIGEQNRVGVPWGTPYEAVAYGGPLADIPSYDSPFLGELVDAEQSCLVLRWLDDAMSVAKAPYPSGIRSAAAWLGLFHREAAARLNLAHSAGLTRYREGVVVAWADLARANLRSILESSSPVMEAIEAVAPIAQALLGADETLVHGDLYPENVLTTQSGVIPVDWEWAGIAAGELDFAALVDGWPESTVSACAVDYRRSRWPSGGGQDFAACLEAARLFLAVRWLGGHSLTTRQPKVNHYLGIVERAVASLGPTASTSRTPAQGCPQ
jgi:hypothetical protein